MNRKRARAVRLMIALVILTAVAVAVGFGHLWAAESAVQTVRILEPADGAEIFLDEGEEMPARRPVRGDITGFTREEIESYQLKVDLSIKTDKSYPQGIVRVRSDGTWSVSAAHFGGAVHIVRAVLKDKNGNEIDTATARVTLIQ